MNNKKDSLKLPWYLNSILISLIVAFSIIVSDPLLFLISLFLLGARFTKDSKIRTHLSKHTSSLEEANANLQDTVTQLQQLINAESTANVLDEIIENKLAEKNSLEAEAEKLKKNISSLCKKYETMSEIDTYHTLEAELSVLQVGLFKKEYSFAISEEYKVELKKIQAQQSACIKEEKAITLVTPDFLKNDSKKIADKVMGTASKLLLRAFNNECDAVMAKITHKNIENSRKRIETSFTQINKLAELFGISITTAYLLLKISEAQLTFEYEVKKQEEQEEQKSIKEQMREEAKVQAEIVKLEKEALKEEELYNKALEKAKAELASANENEQLALIAKIKGLENSLKAAEEKMQRAKSMAEQTRSGFVYIISNIGSFGDNVYKIGMTRRLDPQERINELSNASVPFPFDVHATIYTHDAPALENKLHQAFDSYRINKVNNRKEFFNVSIEDIATKVQELHGEIKLTKQAEAYQYRQSMVEAV